MRNFRGLCWGVMVLAIAIGPPSVASAEELGVYDTHETTTSPIPMVCITMDDGLTACWTPSNLLNATATFVDDLAIAESIPTSDFSATTGDPIGLTAVLMSIEAVAQNEVARVASGVRSDALAFTFCVDAKNHDAKMATSTA